MENPSDVELPKPDKLHKNQCNDEVLQMLGRLVHDLQMERGCTALFVDSKAALFGAELERQYAKTDASVAGVRAIQKQLAAKGVSQRTRRKIAEFVKNLKILTGHRTQVAKLALPFSDAVNTYTYKYTSPIIDTLVETALFTSRADSVKVSAYSNFIQWKERVGRERAWGMHGFCGRSFGDRQFVERFLELIHEQRSYRAAFFSLAAGSQRAIVSAALGDSSVARVHKIHDVLEGAGNDDVLSRISAIEWFDLITAKIDRMYNAEIQLVATLGETAGHETSAGKAPIRRGNGSRGNGSDAMVFAPYLALLRTVPVFASLSPDELDQLLSQAQIRNAEKGKLLVLQGEPASRYYVVLSGWVKLFQATESGAEAILQMLTSGDTLQDT
ncbi:MAG: nitrate- and nitrite sensing domain-containing protein, partial [Alphaproteobacteria bacterium]